MQRFRTILFWCHLIAGVSAGIVILIMSVTGVPLTYEKQMMYWADTRAFAIAPAAGAARLPVDTLLERASAARPGTAIQTITLRRGATEPASVVGPDGTLSSTPTPARSSAPVPPASAASFAASPTGTAGWR